MSSNIISISRLNHVLLAVLLVVLSVQHVQAQPSNNIENKVLIDDLISQIDNDEGKRAAVRLQRGEIFTIISLDGKEGPVISLQDNAFYFGVNNCKNIDEFDSWSFLSFPFKVNTDIDTDARSPAANLKYIIKKNARVVKNGDISQCVSHVGFSRKEIYKASASKVIGGKKLWSFEKKFKEDVDYFRENKPKARIKAISRKSVICNVSARLCYTNGSKLKILSHLSATGVPPLEKVSAKENNFYLQTRQTLGGLSNMFPNLQLKEVIPTKSSIADYVAGNIQNTVIVSVRDNAIGRFKESDIAELKDVGVDLRNLGVRGAHVSIIRPGYPPINETNNKGAISILPEIHNVPNLGVVSSAGFSNGDHSVIEVFGKNVSSNYRGLNVVVLDFEGRVLSSKNFDTHTSSYRTQGLFEASIIQG